MKENYIKSILIFLLILIVVSLFIVNVTTVRAEDNKTIVDPTRTSGGFPKILDEGKWSSQLLYDTIGACYQGTIRWVLLSQPSLLGQLPGPMVQRQMVEHCFCVMDKIRKEIKLEDYRKMVFDQEWTGNIFMVKAMECVGEWQTLPSFFMKIPDNETKKENKIIIKPEESPDSPEESPDQPKEESEGSPQTIFQG
jgi:hypothetical protein